MINQERTFGIGKDDENSLVVNLYNTNSLSLIDQFSTNLIDFTLFAFDWKSLYIDKSKSLIIMPGMHLLEEIDESLLTKPTYECNIFVISYANDRLQLKKCITFNNNLIGRAIVKNDILILIGENWVSTYDMVNDYAKIDMLLLTQIE